MTRAPSPLHSGRPSALPVTPKSRLFGRASSAVPSATSASANASSLILKATEATAWRRLSVAQLRVVHWLESVGVVFAQAVAAGDGEGRERRHPRGVVEEDVLHSLCDGYQV